MQKTQSIKACVFRFPSSNWKDELDANIRYYLIVKQILYHTVYFRVKYIMECCKKKENEKNI